MDPIKRKRTYERAREPKVTISVTLLESERDELATWAREQGVSMSVFLRWFVQNESETRFLSMGL